MPDLSESPSPCPSSPSERRRIRRFFHLSSIVYPVIEWHLLPAYRKALENIELDPALSVLDLATGTGILAGAFSERGHPATGLDFTSTLLRRARRKFPQVEFRRFDLCELDTFPADSYGIVSMGYFLHGADAPFRGFVLQHAARIAQESVVVFDYGPDSNGFVRLIEWVEGSYYPEFINTSRREEFGRAGLEITAELKTSDFGRMWLCRKR